MITEPPLLAACAAQLVDYRKKAGTVTHDQPGDGWTAVLRRQPARVVVGWPEGGYTDAFEVICGDGGDDPGLDYHEVSPELQQIRGPYPIRAGCTAYVKHLALHPQPPGTRGTGVTMRDERR